MFNLFRGVFLSVCFMFFMVYTKYNNEKGFVKFVTRNSFDNVLFLVKISLMTRTLDFHRKQ